MTIYLKKPDGTIEQYKDELMQALRIDTETQGESFGTIYTADSLPDEDKLALGLITQKDIDDKVKQNRIAEIKGLLSNIDTQTVRPLRAKIAGTVTKEDENKLSELETEAARLRDELKDLQEEQGR